jgi:hypothetical protein
MPLVFPGSSRKKGDEPLDPYELPFRDGRRSVPPHLVDMMSGMDTIRFTYSEAIDRVNQRMTRDHINIAYDNVVAGHFRESGR